MLTKISKLHLSYSTKSCRHTLSPNEKILRHIYFFVAFCDNGDRQREPCTVFSTRSENFRLFSSNLKLSSADCLKLNQSKILSSGKARKKYSCVSGHPTDPTKWPPTEKLYNWYSFQGIWSLSDVRKSHRFMKNHVQIYVPKRPRTYEEHLLILLNSSIPDISSSMLTILA